MSRLTTTSQRRVATPPRRGQGQITFLVEKAWRYERTKVVKVAVSPLTPSKGEKEPRLHLQQKISRETAETLPSG